MKSFVPCEKSIHFIWSEWSSSTMQMQCRIALQCAAQRRTDILMMHVRCACAHKTMFRKMSQRFSSHNEKWTWKKKYEKRWRRSKHNYTILISREVFENAFYAHKMKITFTSVYNIVRRKCSFSSLLNAICTYDVHISHILIVYVALSISFSLARSFSTFSPGTNACKYILECCIGVLNASLVALFVLFTIQQQHSSVLFFFSSFYFLSFLVSFRFKNPEDAGKA